ncbi:MAG: TetR/AcrR family transcriptional regulator [Pseudomonadales bacterium]|nr:TetR/AcrR family transcriptional regulator [Pseudomonadales bacterium]
MDTPEISSGAQKVLDAAQELFAEEGFASVSVAAIADKAQVSKANIYHHFESKDKLYSAVLKAACSASAEMITMNAGQNDNYADQLSHFAKSHVLHLTDNPLISSLVIRGLLEESSNIDSPTNDLTANDFDCNFNRLVTLIKAGQEAGQLKKQCHPAAFATLMIGANILFMKARNVLGEVPDNEYPLDPEDFASTMIDILLHGVLTDQQEDNLL